MGSESQTLNDLYNHLQEYTPQTVSMDLPSELGTGRISQTKTKHGIILSDWQMKYHSDMNVHGVNSEEYIQIIFCLNEGISWGMTGEKDSISIGKKESCIYKGHGKTEYAWYEKNSSFSFKSIKIPVKYFSRLLSDNFEKSEIEMYTGKLYTGVLKVNITPTMERLLAETKDYTRYRGGLGHLYLDGKMQELIALYLSEALECDILNERSSTLSQTEVSAIMEAKQIIDSEISYAPSCEEIAGLVHLSESKLTRGFSRMFGMPIHSYIIDQRLTKAAKLLLDSRLNVGEIAAMVGYSKPSNFSAAFKKKYGIVPKKYKETQPVDPNR